MQPLRLLVVATAMVAVLALVAGLAATSDRVDQQQRTVTDTSAAPPATAPPKDDLTVDVPSKKPIVVRLGDTVTLNVTIPQLDTLTVEAFGLRETIADNVKTPVIVEATAEGRFPLLLEDSGKSIGELVVKPPLPASEAPSAPKRKSTTTPVEPSTAASAPAVPVG